MMSSGSTVLRLDFDIFSIGPMLTASPVLNRLARRVSPSTSILTSAGEAKLPSALR